MDHEALANLMEKLADYIDANEVEKQAATVQERSKVVDVMCSKFAEATGEEVSPELRQKLASTDESIISVFEKLASSASPEELGAPSSRPGNGAPQSTKEASVMADDKFMDWVLS